MWAGDRCTLAGLRPDFDRNEQLAELLLELRAELTRQDPRSTFRLFHPPGLA